MHRDLDRGGGGYLRCAQGGVGPCRDKTQSPAPVGMRPVLRWERSAALPAPEGPVTADWPVAPADGQRP